MTGAGLADLVGVVAARIAALAPPSESPLLTRARHRAALEACVAAIREARVPERPLEFRGEDLRHAGDALGRITGRIDVDDMLDVIFRDFCIGK